MKHSDKLVSQIKVELDKLRNNKNYDYFMFNNRNENVIKIEVTDSDKNLIFKYESNGTTPVREVEQIIIELNKLNK